MELQTLPTPVEPSKSPLLGGDADQFSSSFNKASFQFAHFLADHPLFELSELLTLAQSMKDGETFYNAGEIKQAGQRWDQIPRTELSVPQLIDRIENAGAWILIKRAQRDPRYAALLDQGLNEVKKLLGDAFPAKIKKSDALVFITSPNRVTPYHIDRECNFLMQVRGEKTINIFNRYDREVLPEEEIERFWTVDNMNSAIFKEAHQARATSYQLTPGTGVHIPVNAPHWVKNDDNISVTLALTFQFPDNVVGDVYRANYYLRRMGLRPAPPGSSKIRDAIKCWGVSGAKKVRNIAKRALGR